MDFTWQFWCSLTPEVNYRILHCYKEEESISYKVHCKPFDISRGDFVYLEILLQVCYYWQTRTASSKLMLARGAWSMCVCMCVCSGKQKVIVNITVDFVSHILCLSGCNFRFFSTFPSLLIFLFLDFLLYGSNIFSILWVGLRRTGGHLWITVFDPELFNFSVVQIAVFNSSKIFHLFQLKYL